MIVVGVDLSPAQKAWQTRRQRAAASAVPAVLASRYPGEVNDCAVRAFAVAFNIDYCLAHDLFKAHGRKPGRRTACRITHSVLDGTIATRIDRTFRAKNVTRLSHLERLDHNTGAYLIFIRGHAVGYRNNTTSDTGIQKISGPLCKIREIWRIAL